MLGHVTPHVGESAGVRSRWPGDRRRAALGLLSPGNASPGRGAVCRHDRHYTNGRPGEQPAGRIARRGQPSVDHRRRCGRLGHLDARRGLRDRPGPPTSEPARLPVRAEHRNRGAGAAGTAGLRAAAEAIADDLHATIASALHGWQGQWELRRAVGNPFTELSRLAAEINADLVVVGASTRPGHRFVGSLAVHLVKSSGGR